MASATISLDKKTYPLMMHLGIKPKYEFPDENPTYDPSTQISDFSINSGLGNTVTWVSGSTGGAITWKDGDQGGDD